MSARAVRDGRLSPSIQVSRLDLAVLAERVEKRSLAPVRSVYMALIEAAGEPASWTQKALEDRAGVGGGLLKRSMQILTEVGLVRINGDDSIWLGTMAVTARPLPPQEPGEVTTGGPSERAQKFYEAHAAKVTPITGKKPPKGPKQLAAADAILACEPNAAAISARLNFALSHQFYADKVLTLRDFERWFARISAAFMAGNGNGNGREARPDPPAARRTSMEGDRVVVGG